MNPVAYRYNINAVMKTPATTYRGSTFFGYNVSWMTGLLNPKYVRISFLILQY